MTIDVLASCLAFLFRKITIHNPIPPHPRPRRGGEGETPAWPCQNSLETVTGTPCPVRKVPLGQSIALGLFFSYQQKSVGTFQIDIIPARLSLPVSSLFERSGVKMRIQLLLAAAFISTLAHSNDVEPIKPSPGSRLLWEIKTPGGADRVVELAAAKGKLLCVQHGALHAYDAKTGQLLWRYPKEGPATRFADTTYESVRPFIIGVVGDDVVTQVPDPIGQRGCGCVAFKLDDGTVSRQFLLGPEFGGGTDLSSHITGSRIAFWKSPLNPGDNTTPVCVFDLKEWKELGRFSIPGATGELRAIDDKVCGLMIRNGEKTVRAFTADLTEKQLYSVPIRDRQTFQLSLVQLPDGSQLLREGRFSVKCAYMYPCTMEWLDKTSPAFTWDRDGIAGIDPQSQKKLWTCQLESHTAATLVANGDDLLAAGNGFLRIIDTKTGTLKVSIHAADASESALLQDHTQTFALDAERVYWARPFGLKVYRIDSLDPDHVNPDDESEPANAVARCRAALQAGDTDAALFALRGVAVALRLRPAARRSVLEMFSQLRRSPAAAELPKKWSALVCSDGWIAGHMFMEDLEQWAGDEPEAAEALFRMNTDESLRVLAGLVATPRAGRPYNPWSLIWADYANERLTGNAPKPKSLIGKSEWDRGALSPEDYLANGGGEFSAAARAEIESKKKGEGDKEPLTISAPADTNDNNKGDF